MRTKQGTRSARRSLEVRCNRRAAAGKRLEDGNLLKQMAFGGVLECCVKGDGPPARGEMRTWRDRYWAASDQGCAAGITGAELGCHSLTGGPEFSAAYGFVLGNTSARSCSRAALGPHLCGRARLDPFTLLLCEGP